MRKTVDWLEKIVPCPRPVRAGENNNWCSHSSHPPHWGEPLRVIYDHELVLFRKSCFAVEIEGRQYQCPDGSFIIVPPGQWHASWETEGKQGYRYWVHFDWIPQGSYAQTPPMTFHPAKPSRAAYRGAPSFVPRAIIHGHIPNPPRVYELAERLSAIQLQGSEHDRFVSRALLQELLLEILDTRSRKADSSNRKEDLPHMIRDLIEKNMEAHHQLRIKDLMEKELGYSYEHLCRIFKEKYGVPPLKYLNALCISRAKLLLRDTDLQVAVIASRLGFHDPMYFSQLFRKYTRQTPSRYRSSHS